MKVVYCPATLFVPEKQSMSIGSSSLGGVVMTCCGLGCLSLGEWCCPVIDDFVTSP
jgi:hypothetical protein